MKPLPIPSRSIRQPPYLMLLLLAKIQRPEAIPFSKSMIPRKTGRTHDKHPHHHPGPTSDKKDRRPSVSDPAANRHAISLDVDGQHINIRSQIQLYCTNDQLSHPYVSPALGNLAGLPPLFVLAGDKEVLRDEIIYT
jgi:acetyl esterase/lipase